MRRMRLAVAALGSAVLSAVQPAGQAPAIAQSGLSQAGFEAVLPPLRADAPRARGSAATADPADGITVRCYETTGSPARVRVTLPPGSATSAEPGLTDGHRTDLLEQPLEPAASVNGGIEAGSIVVSGTMTGSLHATTRVDIRPGATVGGEIHTPVLVIDDGAVVSAKIEMPKRSAAARLPIAV